MSTYDQIEQELDRMRRFRDWLNYRQNRYSVAAMARITNGLTGTAEAVMTIHDRENPDALGRFYSVDQALKKIGNPTLTQGWQAETHPRKPAP